MQNSIFLHGILRRSGTNFLNELLLLHPDLQQPTCKIRENWFLHFTEHLESYQRDLHFYWENPQWGGDEFDASLFKKHLGEAQINYLLNYIDQNNSLLTKTPSVKHLPLFSEYFSNSKLIVLVRNPLDVASSTYFTWKIPVKSTLEDWYKGVNEIYKLEKSKNNNYLLLRYEDLIANPIYEIKRCLEYLEMTEDGFKWSEIDKMPILGSSEDGKTWKVKEKKKDFIASNKWKKLPQNEILDLQAYFNKEIAGYFGYENALTLSPSDMPDKNMRIATELKFEFGVAKDVNLETKIKRKLKKFFD